MKRSTTDIMTAACESGAVVPAFNIPFIPMMEPVVRALRDADSFGLVQVARLEWIKFGAGGLREIRDEYERVKDERHTRLHLDHVPVVDEDGERVDWEPVIAEALDLGYESVMLDGSRLPFEENAAATAKVVRMAHDADVPAEAELGAVLGHEAGPLPPYEELFESGKGFTDPDEAKRFVEETGVDWLSVAVGNIHGAISGAASRAEKPEARLNIDHLRRIRGVTGVPLVLHGGSGIRKTDILAGIRSGICKINIGAAVRKPWLDASETSEEDGRQAVYDAVTRVISDELEIAGSAPIFGSNMG